MMTARSRGYNQDWDPMREDFDNTSYDPQNADDNSSGFVNLDHCRLYVTRIPNGLSEDGLSTAFSKYGRLTEVFVNKHPEKRYGLVAFETPGEAKLAMMKLNKTEPLKLQISIAYKSNARTKRPIDNTINSGYRSNHSNGPRRDDRSARDDAGSNGSQSNTRRQDSMANGDNMEDLIDDDPVLSRSTLEPDVNLELEKLKLEHLKLQEAQVLCKHRMLLLKQAEKKSSTNSRCILPDGRIVVRNADKGESHDADGSFGAGAGDAPKIPGLQSFGVCVACGQRAEAFCSGCRVTPYCGPACQRRDWHERHKHTCHNLKRQSAGVSSRLEVQPEIPAAAPLRRPHSPGAGSRDSSDRLPPRKFGPPGSAGAPTPAANAASMNARGRQADRGLSDRGRFNRSNEDDNRPNARPYDRNKENRRIDDRPERAGAPDGGSRRYGQPAGGKPKHDEDWGPKPSEPKPAAKPSPGPKEPASPTPAAAAAPSPPRPIASVADVAPVPRKTASQTTPAPVQTRPELVPKSPVAPIAPVADVAPAARKPAAQAAPAPVQARPALVPKNCVIDTLSLKDTFMLTAESAASDGAGLVCVSLHVDHSDNYERLLDPLSQACEASEAFQPGPGDTFAYLDPADGGWYRARRLSATRAALLDAARVAPLSPADRCRELHSDYAVIPEFCCLLESGKVQLKDQVQCTVMSKSGSDLTVSLTHLETGADLGTGRVRRWLPAVERPEPAAVERPEPAAVKRPEPAAAEPMESTAKPASAPGGPPQVPRPAVQAGGAVILVDATEPARAYVRPAARALNAHFNDIICDVMMYGLNESTPRLKELPTAGQTVVARYTDGNYYRALVQRVSTKHRRCLLELVDYGNVAIVEDLSSLCPCPPELELSARPTLTSAVCLSMKQKAFSAAATAYLDKLKLDEEELTLTILSGEKTGADKTPVRLTVVKSGEDVNRTVDQLSTPEWQKLLERGGDVLETETMFFQQIKYVDPPTGGGDMEILDCSLLEHGMLAGHIRHAEHARRALGLAAQLEEYCNSALAKDPYTPRDEELCIAMCPTRKQWLRAVMLQQEDGAGSAAAKVLFFDYGYMSSVPVASLRRMMPEFAAVPAATATLCIKDFPPEPTAEQLERARRHLQLSEHGVGALKVTGVARQDIGEYLVHAPDLIRAIA